MSSTSNLHAELPSDFDGWWDAPGEWVEPPNQRRDGWSGMMRVHIGEECFYVKKQRNHLYRSFLHPLGRPTASREYDNILALRKLGLNVPDPVFHGSRKSAEGFDAVLVTRELSGFRPLSEQTGLTAQQSEALATETGQVLGIMHRACLQHSCLYAKHIMVRWNGALPEVALIDLEKLRRPPLPWRASQHDLDQLRRHQSTWRSEQWETLIKVHAATRSGLAER